MGEVRLAPSIYLPSYIEPAYNKLMENPVYDEDARNPDRAQIVWITPLAIMKS